MEDFAPTNMLLLVIVLDFMQVYDTYASAMFEHVPLVSLFYNNNGCLTAKNMVGFMKIIRESTSLRVSGSIICCIMQFHAELLMIWKIEG